MADITAYVMAINEANVEKGKVAAERDKLWAQVGKVAAERDKLRAQVKALRARVKALEVVRLREYCEARRDGGE